MKGTASTAAVGRGRGRGRVRKRGAWGPVLVGSPVFPDGARGPHLGWEEMSLMHGSHLFGMGDGEFRCWSKATQGACCYGNSYFTQRG